ncbi:RimK family alpha-L-glutamate ligase [Candidatus Woesearchaeota archaeon]|nr:RimK family alpha-L-glutamate ligase [Candidatus Woesearchaeota archaeon]
MKAALISLGSKSSLMTLDAMKKYFNSVEDINLRNVEVILGSKNLSVLYNGKPLEKYEGIYAKGSFRYAPLLSSITAAFYANTYMPIKADTFTIGHDKLLTHLALQYYKIPMPDTYVVSSVMAAKKILEQVNYPIVLKFPHGTQGKGVMIADSFAAASSMLDAIETLKQPFLMQEYIETQGCDIRTIVVGNNVVASMKRKAVRGEKRANIHAGGKGEPIVLDSYTKKIAVDTAKSIGAEICAVDILETVKGPSVIEANLSPGLQGITSVTKIDVADKIAQFMYERTKEFVDKGKTEETTKMFTDLNVSASAGKNNSEQQIITTLDFRSERILLPKIITSLAKFNEREDVVIKAQKGKVTLQRY